MSPETTLGRRHAMAWLLAGAVPAWAQAGWPGKPLRIVVAFTPGSATDLIARLVGEKLGVQLGQPVVVENRPGASGTIGAVQVVRAEADGTTLLVNSSSHTVAPSTFANLPYDTVRDLSGVLPLASIPNLLVVGPGRFKTPQELVAAAKARPGAMTYASGGNGSAAHLNAERFRLAAGFEALHVPFKGAPEALTEVMAGRVDFYFCPITPALPLLREGKLTALAAGGAKRAASLPELPTTLEAGFADSDHNFWVGLFAPSRTPREVVDRLHREATHALAQPELRERLARVGAEPMPMSPDQFDAYVRQEIVLNAGLVKAAGIKPG